MKYFPQRNLTDCLLACLECFLQTSREEFYKDLLEFVELKDINGVKAFQDWLDDHKAGWASGYKYGKLNQTGSGWGRMGPRTSKAWGLFKDEYLNPQKLTKDITPQEIKQINVDTEPKSDLGTQSPVTNTTTTTSTETISQYPPSEPGQPGEYKDGWYYDEKSQQWYKPQ